MPATTQKQEAMQAVRLLWGAIMGGGSSDHKNPEMLYRARVLLEGFIESAGVSENTDIEDGVEITVSNGECIVVPSDFYEWLKSTGAQP